MALGYNGYADWMLAETSEEVKENRREEELTSGVKREETSCYPLYQGILRRVEKNFWRILSADVLQTLEHSMTVVGTPKRSSRERQSGWSSIQDKL